MKKLRNNLLIILISFFVILDVNANESIWIQENDPEKFKLIEKQFRGFDVSMMEVGYRYQELYWAGKEKNWSYAKYQVDKIELSIKNALIRRPKRKNSSKYFLDNVLPEIKNIIEKKESNKFEISFTKLTNGCNTCHTQEKVEFFRVNKPKINLSIISIK